MAALPEPAMRGERSEEPRDFSQVSSSEHLQEPQRSQHPHTGSNCEPTHTAPSDAADTLGKTQAATPAPAPPWSRVEGARIASPLNKGPGPIGSSLGGRHTCSHLRKASKAKGSASAVCTGQVRKRQWNVVFVGFLRTVSALPRTIVFTRLLSAKFQ